MRRELKQENTKHPLGRIFQATRMAKEKGHLGFRKQKRKERLGRKKRKKERNGSKNPTKVKTTWNRKMREVTLAARKDAKKRE